MGEVYQNPPTTRMRHDRFGHEYRAVVMAGVSSGCQISKSTAQVPAVLCTDHVAFRLTILHRRAPRADRSAVSWVD